MNRDSSESGSPLLIGLGGVGSDLVAMVDPGSGADLLLIDTDHRVAKRHPALRALIIGEDIVRGEGCGGNKNLGRACFRRDMGHIIQEVNGHSPVVLVCGAGGGTGLPGAAEIALMLSGSGTPRFSFVLGHRIPLSGGLDPMAVASVLLEGPLSPGSLVTTAPEGSTLESGQMSFQTLAWSLGIFMRCMSDGAVSRISGGSLEHMEAKKEVLGCSLELMGSGPEGIGGLLHSIEDEVALVPICLPSGLSASIVEEVLQRMDEAPDDLHAGICRMVSPGDVITAFVIRRMRSSEQGLQREIPRLPDDDITLEWTLDLIPGREDPI